MKGYTIWFKGDDEHRMVKQDALDRGESMRDALLSGRYAGGFVSKAPERVVEVVPTPKVVEEVKEVPEVVENGLKMGEGFF